MTPITIGLLVSAAIFAGGLVGMYLHRLLPDQYLSKETHDVVRLGTGMLSVLASLVLGLLIATAKSSYDTTDSAVRSYAAELALLNEVLRDYGSAAAVPRDRLRAYIEMLVEHAWPENGKPPIEMEDQQTQRLLESVREAIRALKPVDAAQESLQTRAKDVSVSLLRQRWLLIELQGASVKEMPLTILASWIVVIFVSFGLNAPRNGVVVGAFAICSLAIGGAIFLILELDQPLNGIMRISSWPMQSVLAQMNW